MMFRWYRQIKNFWATCFGILLTLSPLEYLKRSPNPNNRKTMSIDKKTRSVTSRRRKTSRLTLILSLITKFWKFHPWLTGRQKMQRNYWRSRESISKINLKTRKKKSLEIVIGTNSRSRRKLQPHSKKQILSQLHSRLRNRLRLHNQRLSKNQPRPQVIQQRVNHNRRLQLLPHRSNLLINRSNNQLSRQLQNRSTSNQLLQSQPLKTNRLQNQLHHNQPSQSQLVNNQLLANQPLDQ